MGDIYRSPSLEHDIQHEEKILQRLAGMTGVIPTLNQTHTKGTTGCRVFLFWKHSNYLELSN